jgi:hypothetical protein
MSIERRIEKLENREEAMNTHTILKVVSDGEPEPTEEEVEAAKKKFLEEHPGHQGLIVLNFEEGITPKEGKGQ